MTQDLAFEDLGHGVFRIRLRRPQRMNALGVAATAALRQAALDAAERQARVVLVQGSGPAFCAGADLKERQAMDLPARLAHNADINEAIAALAALPCVTVAVLNGLALGGGLELAMACDLRIAAAGVKLGLTESRIGAIPGAGGTQRLPRLVGVGRALQMMLTGEPVGSEHALEIGLVNEVVAPERLDSRARELATLLAGRSAAGLAAIKRLTYAGLDLPLADGLRMERAALPGILGSAEYAEGIAALLERKGSPTS
ncbi:enoyl-CoA hydratase-related protein [Pigmentiphaga soli]|uniref:Enoyl-CoA hydratase-related protein n=1 Tax=Pigmentiphaga soli TaxID=1007095 RepID=A0ABP8HHW6_9BURK